MALTGRGKSELNREMIQQFTLCALVWFVCVFVSVALFRGLFLKCSIVSFCDQTKSQLSWKELTSCFHCKKDRNNKKDKMRTLEYLKYSASEMKAEPINRINRAIIISIILQNRCVDAVNVSCINLFDCLAD